MDIKKFEKNMTAFSHGFQQDVLTYLTHLRLNNWSVKDTQSWLEIKERKRIAQEKVFKKEYKILINCPLCKAKMDTYPVNDQPSTQTGDLTDKSVSLCRNKECMNTIYNKKSLDF